MAPRSTGSRYLIGTAAVAALGMFCAPAPGSAPAQDQPQTPPSPPIVVSEAAHEQFVFAHRLMRINRLDMAAEAFDRYLRDFPNDEKHNDGRYFRAELAMGAGDIELADRLLSDIGTTRVITPTAVRVLQAQVDLAKGRVQPAIQKLEAVDTDDLPERTAAWVSHLRGRAYVASDNLPAAARQLERAARVEYSQQPAAFFEWGQVLASLGQTDRAIAALGRCIAMRDPVLSPRAARLGADLALKNRQFDRAAQFAESIIENFAGSSEFPGAVLDLLWAHQGNGEHEKIIETADRHRNALSGADRFMAEYLAGVASFDLRRFEQAASRMDQLRRRAPDWERRPLVLETLARSYYELERFDDLRRLYEQMVEQHPDTESLARTRVIMARWHLANERGREALTLLREVTESGPRHPVWTQAMRQKVVTYEQLGRFDDALAGYTALLKEATAADSEQRNHWRLRQATMQMRLEKFDEARKAAEGLLEVDGLEDDLAAAARLLLGQALGRLNEHDRAIAVLTELIDKDGNASRVANAMYWRGLMQLVDRRPERAVEDLLAAGGSEVLESNLRVTSLRIASEVQRRLGDDSAARASLGLLENLVGMDRLTAAERIWLARYTANRARDAEQHRQVLRYLAPLLDNQDRLRPAVAAEADFLAAVTLRELGQRDEAIRGFHKVIGLGQGFGSAARLELARTMAADEPTRALGQYDLLLRHDGESDRATLASSLDESARILLRLARQFERDQRPEQARRAMRDAERRLLQLSLIYRDRRFSPLPELALIELEAIARGQNRADDARRAMQDLEQLAEDGPWKQYARAMLMVADGRSGSALEILRRLRDLPPPAELAGVVRQRIAELE
ncbi:MAG: tetratricopeptide repeat protein [Phycisphaeraceae bacterium]|nr:tetratricopeptide repeat protein [Phycisphaeraceae bacterium]